MGVGDGEREELSGSRAEAVSLASCATNIAKDSSSAYGEVESLRLDGWREEEEVAWRGSELGGPGAVAAGGGAGGGTGGAGWELPSVSINSSSESSSSITSLECKLTLVIGGGGLSNVVKVSNLVNSLNLCTFQL